MNNINIKTAIIVFILVLIVNAIHSQNNNTMITDVDITIFSSSYQKSKADIENFIKQSEIKILNQKESEKTYNVYFYLNEKGFKRLDSLLPSLGYVSDKDLSTVNNDETLKAAKLELIYLKDKKIAYDSILVEMPEKTDRYYRYWEEIREIDKKIFELNLKIQNLNAKNNYIVNLTIYDETKDFTTDRISWVNMPGASFNMLFVESPKADLSYGQYMGYSLKYLFTRGKSYVNLSVFKENDDNVKGDSLYYTELFMFGFGQDFYTKYFGRGKRKYLNLYTGYNAGGFFATGEKRKNTILYLQAFLGLELFKNKYILIDNRIGYFVPFSKNRNLRGISYSASFNFVF